VGENKYIRSIVRIDEGNKSRGIILKLDFRILYSWFRTS